MKDVQLSNPAEKPKQHGSADGHGQPSSAFEGVPANALPLTASEDRQWATLSHFGGILGFIPSLLILLIFKNRGPFTAQEAREAFNFTFPPTLLAFAAWLLSMLPTVGGLFAVVNALIWVAIAFSSAIAGIQVNRGRPYRYTLNLRLFK
ncbi:DUF4870 domain-containing protein [Arthrobacter sp. CAN_C5]|uniref:DUF4870 domain-containing protein n=1 Tax=unclassified Arthrobacter TaxID=235627 RepID=UPI0018C8F86D